jgi:glycerol-3-phosphate acyltransferase PlsY
MRIGGKKAAALTLFGDALKGVIPVLLAYQLGLPEKQIGWVGLAAVIGHLFPIFFGFQGGKGVATTLGVVHAWHWPTGLMIDLIWLIFAKVFRISSVAALVALVSLPFILAAWQTDYWLAALIISVLSLYRHKENIQKLISGEESAIGDRVNAADK